MAGSSLTELPFSSGDAQLMPIIISIRFNTKYRLGRIGPKWTHCLSFATNNGFLYIAPRSLGWPLRSQLILTYLGESILLYFVHFLLVDHVLSSYFTFDSLPWKKSTDFILIKSCFMISWSTQGVKMTISLRLKLMVSSNCLKSLHFCQLESYW